MTKAQGIAFTEFGSADVLHPLETDVPEPGPGQVRIAVRAAGVNPLDHKIRAGYMNAVFPVALPHVPGVEAAGVVESVGEGVSGLAVGDEVFGPTVTGSYAALALAEAAKLGVKPASLGFQEAAALPVAAETAFRALEALGVRSGETLVVHGAAGGVGTLAVQFAVSRGLRVVGTASEANHEHLRRLGAVPVSYGPGVVERVREAAPDGVDAAFDTTGLAESLAASVELTGGKERVLTIGSPVTAGEYGVAFSSGAGPAGYRGVPAFAEALALHEAGTLDVAIHRAYPLAEAADAQRASEAGHLAGKIVLLP
ncbi:NADP-dependent oxidoreductase [Actinacidiphila bryophytorum]|uniref:NADPH:quinone reductase n=1 Tax=Actinacidiphila bryophytorum TaxID=1436133 RepID=A0A9W4E2P1_9ACTN|nr:NADP-dependent oxidoreductase [Actinacidiphila bryophytorum]MBM9435438.1 NADP-dependent oxidoreductase [Actinacidiphila bryophytorum]MBN6547331.1 NADP-dependent oxidoreductase [Actinacidiphila bryophytorum]CAG7608124.1 NADPH:quinone reductase [Actinacidiphila bryophytorum]